MYTYTHTLSLHDALPTCPRLRLHTPRYHPVGAAERWIAGSSPAMTIGGEGETIGGEGDSLRPLLLRLRRRAQVGGEVAAGVAVGHPGDVFGRDRKSTRLNSSH